MSNVTNEEYDKALEVIKAKRLSDKQKQIEKKKKENADILGKYFKFENGRNTNGITYEFIEKVLDEDTIQTRSFNIIKNFAGIQEMMYYRKDSVNIIIIDKKNEITKEEYDSALKQYFRFVLDELEIDLRK